MANPDVEHGRPPHGSSRDALRVIAQVLELGTFEEGEQLRQALGDGHLAGVLQRAEPGWFSPRSWTYWQRKLGVAPSGTVPALPHRRLGT